MKKLILVILIIAASLTTVLAAFWIYDYIFYQPNKKIPIPGCVSIIFIHETSRQQAADLLNKMQIPLPSNLFEEPRYGGAFIPTVEISSLDLSKAVELAQEDTRILKVVLQPGYILFSDTMTVKEVYELLDTHGIGYYTQIGDEDEVKKATYLHVKVDPGFEQSVVALLLAEPIVKNAEQCYEIPPARPL